MKNLLKNLGIFLGVFLVLTLVFAGFQSFESRNDNKNIGLGDLAWQVGNDQTESVSVEGSKVYVKLKSGEEKIALKESSESLIELLKNLGVPAEKIAAANIQIKDNSDSDFFWTIILPILLPFLLIGFFVFFMMRSVSGANNKAMMFGQSGAKESARRGK
jgi:ATP-dependent Zn protease